MSYQPNVSLRYLQSVGAAVLGLAALCLSLAVPACAQSVVVNAPSTDITEAKHLYLEMDLYTHPISHQLGGFQVYIPRMTYGLTKNIEVGLNVTVTNALEPKQPVEVQPNVKWRFYNNEKNGVAASGGLVYYATVAHRAGSDNFGLIYSNVSKKFKSDFGPRLTAGGYGLVGRADGNGPKGGVTLSYEQPLHPKVTWINDWFSGKNRFGYASTGLAYAPNPHTSVAVTYSFGNYGRGNNGIFAWVGYTF